MAIAIHREVAGEQGGDDKKCNLIGEIKLGA